MRRLKGCSWIRLNVGRLVASRSAGSGIGFNGDDEAGHGWVEGEVREVAFRLLAGCWLPLGDDASFRFPPAKSSVMVMFCSLLHLGLIREVTFCR